MFPSSANPSPSTIRCPSGPPGPGSRRHELYDLAEDPFETHDLSGAPAEAEMADMLRTALAALEAPGDQFERLAL